ncbi:GH23659 [Drosophila grimshawi]|uniref:GH23659 n=1 Tax=Drosophila grimshawi TaxID=7222 RepID=B4K1S3_DROGR|nr:GH23659 [Drosophila grimshawi]
MAKQQHEKELNEVEQEVQQDRVEVEEQQQLLLNKQLKFSAPAYTEIRTRSGGLHFKVSGAKKKLKLQKQQQQTAG